MTRAWKELWGGKAGVASHVFYQEPTQRKPDTSMSLFMRTLLVSS